MFLKASVPGYENRRLFGKGLSINPIFYQNVVYCICKSLRENINYSYCLIHFDIVNCNTVWSKGINIIILKPLVNTDLKENTMRRRAKCNSDANS